MSACGYPGQYPAYEGGWPLSGAAGQAECRGQTLVLVSQPHCREWRRGRADWWPGRAPGGPQWSAQPLCAAQARPAPRSGREAGGQTEAGAGQESQCQHRGEWWGHNRHIRPPQAAQAPPAEHGRGTWARGRGGPPQVRVHTQHGGGQREHRALRHTWGQAGVSPCQSMNSDRSHWSKFMSQNKISALILQRNINGACVDSELYLHCCGLHEVWHGLR